MLSTFSKSVPIIIIVATRRIWRKASGYVTATGRSGIKGLFVFFIHARLHPGNDKLWWRWPLSYSVEQKTPTPPQVQLRISKHYQ